jgi:hypothetical protein
MADFPDAWTHTPDMDELYRNESGRHPKHTGVKRPQSHDRRYPQGVRDAALAGASCAPIPCKSERCSGWGRHPSGTSPASISVFKVKGARDAFRLTASMLQFAL